MTAKGCLSVMLMVGIIRNRSYWSKSSLHIACGQWQGYASGSVRIHKPTHRQTALVMAATYQRCGN